MAREKLITTTAELKSGMSSVQADVNYESIRSFIDDAEINHIIGAIGQAMYDALLTDTPNAKQSRVLFLLTKAVANFAIHYFVAFGSVAISESGILVVKTDRMLPASDKKLFLLRTQSRSDGFKAMEAAVNYLEANRADFPQYITSTAHAGNRRFYVNSTEEFSTGYNLQGNSEVFYSLKAVLGTVEENYIDTILGNTVSEALRTSILAGTTTSQQNKLLVKIAKAVALLTIAEAIPYNLVSITPNGLITSNIGTNTENMEISSTPDQRRLQGMMNVMLQKGMSEVGKLTKWLNDNAADFTAYTVIDQSARNNINAQINGQTSGVHLL